MPLLIRRAAIVLLLSMAGSHAWAQSAPTAPATVRMRGSIVSVGANSITVRDRGGETVELALSEKLTVSETYPIALSDIQPGSFIGTAALPQPDGSLRAIAITVFPETSRGVGEGHRPFDLLPQSTMTNATVADVVTATAGRTLQLKYKDGEKFLVVPADAPVVTFRPSDRSLLVPGASVSLFAQAIDGRPTALRISAGRNGFQLPY